LSVLVDKGLIGQFDFHIQPNDWLHLDQRKNEWKSSMKTARLSNFKQINLSTPPSLFIVAALTAACTVVFNSRDGICQTSTDPNVAAAPVAAAPVKKVTEDKMSTSRPKETKDLPNFHKVTDYLYRGGEPSPAGMHELQKMGVKTLIDLRAKTEAAHNEEMLAKQLGMKYINMTMTAEAPTKKQVETLLATIDSAKEKNEPVLVHCAHGSDRTGCMIGIWRVARDGWAFDDTYKEMRKYWFGVKYDKLRNAVKQSATH